jgi:hypothetical protein
MKCFYVHGVSILVIDPTDSAVFGMINVNIAREVIYIVFVISSNTRIFDSPKAWIMAKVQVA